MFRFSSLVCALVALFLGCASDAAEWRPAKSAPEKPAVKDAFRVKAVSSDCITLGVVHAEGPNPIADIAQTAARHGANNYIVRGDDADERVTTVEDEGLTDRRRLVTRTNHKLWAEAYRCPSSDDLPK